MTATSPIDVGVVDHALTHSAACVERAGARSWRVALQNGKRVDALATLSGPWFTLAAPLYPPVVASPWQLLALNRALPGGVRFTLSPRGHAPVLCVDTWLGSEHDDDSQRVADACAALLGSVSIFANGDTCASDVAASTGLTTMNDSAASMCPVPADHLHEGLAWAYTRLDDGRLRFDLDVRNDRYHALLAGDACGLSCDVELVSKPTLSTVSRQATSVALLTSGCALRLARATSTSDLSTDRVAFQVRLPRSANAADIDLALEALMAGCEQLGREVRALTDSTLATSYLAVVMPHQPT